MKAARGVTLPSAVILRGGRGAKAAHNGQSAQLGASKGSWTTVVLGGETVKWRTGHWEEAVAAVAPPAVRDIFSWLPDALALEVLALLPMPDLCRARMASRALNGLPAFTECSLRNGMPAGYGVRPCRQLDFARMLGVKTAQLRSMHIDFGSHETDVVRWLLQECDCSRLETVKLRCDGKRGQMILSQPTLPGSSSTPLDLSRAIAQPRLPTVFGLKVRRSKHLTMMAALAQFCPALKSLSLPKGIGDIPSLAKIKSLCRLEANFLEVDDINFAVSNLPCLTHLTLLGGNQGSLYREVLDFESESLQFIDMTESSKALFFERLACPRLRQICCKSGERGNGIRLAVSARELIDGAPWHPDTDFELFDIENRQLRDCTFEIGGDGRVYFARQEGEDVSSTLATVSVPPDCEVVFDTYRDGYPHRVLASRLAEVRVRSTGITLDDFRRAVRGWFGEPDWDVD